MKNVILNILVMLIVASSYAQSIKGKIVDKNTNESIENATIKVVKTNEYAVSNLEGEFTIAASEGDLVEISHVSY